LAKWDVFHADRLELVRGLNAEEIRSALARGELRDDDLVRPAGTTVPWARLAEMPELLAARIPTDTPRISSAASPRPGGDVPGDGPELKDFEEVQSSLEDIIPPPKRHEPTELPEPTSTSDVAFPVLEAEPESSGRRASDSAAPAASAWVWDEENDEDDGEGTAGQDDCDIEILEDESELEDLDSAAAGDGGGARPRAPVTPSGRADESRPDRNTDLPAAIMTQWDAGPEDLDLDVRPDSRASHVALPVVSSRDRDEGSLPGDDEEDPEAEFSLSRSATQKIEELDLAPMVDVAFQLVLFFMVTATTVLYKTLEIPKPSAEAPAAAVAQGRSRSLDDLKDDYILVEIDDRGTMKLDREPIEPAMATLVEQLRTAREKTGRKSMLLSADFATPHRNAVLAYDAANEIGLGIAIARPKEPQGPAPTLRGAPPALKGAGAPIPAPASAAAAAPF
jgi:biopolymer transport protein ExbD